MSSPETITYAVPRPERMGDTARPDYNATIVGIRDTGGGLRVLRVEPDAPIEGFQAGRYLPMGRGYWEPRFDGLDVEVPEAKRNRIVSRPYSLSSSMISQGHLHDPGDHRCLEFYIAPVAPPTSEPPAELTPRLFATSAGDRVLLGPRIAGHYTLDAVGPTDNVVLAGTGTGEAPHNAMVAELARSGHRGKVTVLSTSRNRDDFAYLAQHRELERLWNNYRYFPLSTRQPADGIKRYVQDILTVPDPADWLGFPLDPDRTHVFLCGNPSMVGTAKWEEDSPVFETSGGALEILHQRGFTLDRKGAPAGNVHFEEYW
ncbi:MAG: ferredoxin--NADP reductase [Actinomycetia bacterium]|nr:ferredoxin--NADP reductase [Actinomycetes bacterium]